MLLRCQQRTYALQQTATYSIYSSAINNRLKGTSMSSARAVVRLMLRVNLVGNWIDRSPTACPAGCDRRRCRLPKLFFEIDTVAHQSAGIDEGAPARAASGHAIPIPPRRVMNSRLFIQLPRRQQLVT
jgi:hypothetical protein